MLDKCIEDNDNKLVQYYTPKGDADENEVDGIEIDGPRRKKSCLRGF